jgi:NAD(P) transhydrogenase subunit alpha
MIIGVPVELYPNEQRVALVPSALPALTKAGLKILIEKNAGQKAGFPDPAYVEQGATIASTQAQLFSEADIIVQLHGFTDPSTLSAYRKNQIVVGLLDPLGTSEPFAKLAQNGVITFALELLPRISRAQSMDALSSMATIAGYKAVLLAADTLKKMFPMMITAAGTITPSKVFVIGAGVAGLQAIATAKRLGAVVQAYDVRPAVKEQVESLGAQFVELPLETQSAEGAGGYAKEMDESFYKRQREMMVKVLAESDVTIATAAVPGKKAPILITKDMVSAMRSGSVIVDIAAETGGNCELTKPGETVQVDGISILGPVNLPSTIPFHASQMYAKNVGAFLQMLVKNGQVKIDLEDPVIKDTLITYEEKIFNSRVSEKLGLVKT